MAIYHITFNSLVPNRQVWSKAQTATYRKTGAYPAKSETSLGNDFLCLRERLSKSTDTFVFIITKLQWEKWRERVEEYKLYDFLHYEMPYFVSNRRYPDYGRKLRLVVLKGKKNAD